MRDAKHYNRIRQYFKELRTNEVILAKYYPMCNDESNCIPILYFTNEGFIWDRYDEIINHKNRHYYRVGSFAFKVQKSGEDKTVFICKLSEFQ